MPAATRRPSDLQFPRRLAGFRAAGILLARCAIRFLQVASPRYALTLLLALVLVDGCAPRPPLTFAQDGAVDLPTSSAVIFFVDGVNRRVMERLLERGSLPNIDRLFVRGGVKVEHAITSLPSITYPNAVSILTGRFPGHHGVLGNRWFDRRRMICRDYGTAATYRDVNDDFQCPTIYDILSDHFTVNVQCHTRRGVTVTFDNWAASGIDWFLHAYSNVDRRVGDCMEPVVGVARRVGRWPTVLFNYFPGVDEVGHRYGPDSARYREALQVADRAIGKVVDAIVTAGLADRTYFVLLTDHGHVPHTAERMIDAVEWLRQHFGWRIYPGRTPDDDYVANFARLKPYDAVVICGAFRRLVIHLRGSRGWAYPPSREEITRILDPAAADPAAGDQGLLDLPGAGLICTRAGPDSVNVISAHGAATVERRIKGVQRFYRLVCSQADNGHAGGPQDVLGYRCTPELASFVDAGWHSSREWLAATASTRYPDFVPQVVEMFDTPRAGDIVVFAAADWSFNDRFIGGHGSCLAQDMHVPMYFAGPDLPPGGSIDHARLVDVMPTVLDLLGEHDRLLRIERIDGVSVASELRQALPRRP